MYYSLVYNTCLCRKYTLIQCGVYLIYVYVVLWLYMIYSNMLYLYMHMYSCRGLDLISCDSIRYTIALCLYMHLFISDNLILCDCYILICLVYILICVFIASAGSLPNIEHLFAQQCSTVLWCCQVVQIMGIDRWFGIELCYSVGRLLTCIEFGS